MMILGCKSAIYANQRGAVLIMALLIVALVTTIVVSVTWRFELGMARNENRWHGVQARAYLEAGEGLASYALKADYFIDQTEDRPWDDLTEEWAMPQPPFPTDEGWFRGSLEDAQGRINLNLLVYNEKYDPEKDPPHERYSSSQKRFLRLLQLMELEEGSFLDPDLATGILDAISDWIDADNETTGFYGAEADYYDSLDPPYVIANREMATISELSMVKGITPELFQMLEPYVSALPGPRAAPIGAQPPQPVFTNLRTMKPILMRTLNRKDVLEPLTEEEWLTMLQARGGPLPGMEESQLGNNAQPVPVGEFKTIEEFAELPEVKAILGEAGDKGTFDGGELVVRSRYFYLNTETLVGEQLRRGKSLLFRDLNKGGNTSVIRRTSANY